MLDFLAKALRIRKVLSGRDFYQSRQVKKDILTFGNRFADWTFCPAMLSRNSLVYSFGVGRDISFDLGLINHFNLQVYAFDPSPDSIQWIKNQNLPDIFHFYPFGLANRDGTAEFLVPDNPKFSSLSITESEPKSNKTISLKVNKLSTILNELKHSKIDLLKMDIEGAEYLVLDDILETPVEIDQLLIEFHHRFGKYNIHDTKRAINKLNQAGYFIFHVSQTGEEFSFIKRY